jgi:hypothetical protein
MNTIRRKTVLGRWNRLTAGGVCLAALGLAGLFLALASGWHAGNLALFVLEAVGGLTLTTIGFVLMVLGADPFADGEGFASNAEESEITTAANDRESSTAPPRGT